MILLFIVAVMIGVAITNLFLLIFAEKTNQHKLGFVIFDGVVIGVGFLILLANLTQFYDYGQPPYRIGQFQGFTPVATAYTPVLVLLIVLASLAWLALRIEIRRKYPPLVKVILLIVLLVAVVYAVVFVVQLHEVILNSEARRLTRATALSMALYPINFMLIIFRVIYLFMIDELEQAKTKQQEKPLTQLTNKLMWFSKYAKLLFCLGIPIFVVLLVVLILSNQMPEVILRPFEETSHWYLSRHQWNRPGYLQRGGGHYLCTVAVYGHPSRVKPLREGIRHGQPILVNRQLLIANAFEQKIMESFPAFHKHVRGIYDKYGYPLSTHITTARRANTVYVLMKPLEWFFLVTLYLVDTEPEKRISSQYKNPRT